MADDGKDGTKHGDESDVCFVDEVLPEEQMLAMGLPISFGAKGAGEEMQSRTEPSSSLKRRWVERMSL